MCVSFESQSLPGHRDVLKLVELTAELFSQKKNSENFVGVQIT